VRPGTAAPTGRRDPRSLLLLAVGAVIAWVAWRHHVVSEDDLLFLAVLIPSVILHEVSHGVVALWFGDDTAKKAGRLTLNPLKHVDPFGTIVLPVLLVLTTGRPFGYAKPVPVNVRRLRNPRNDSLLVSLAGPVTNLLLVAVATVVLRTVDVRGNWGRSVVLLGVSNVVLAVFNLLPLPPLDGSAVVERLLPHQWWPGWLKFRQYSMGLLLVLVLLLPQVLNSIFDRALDVWVRFLP
jgi:Zn-dependent protease